MDPDSAMSDVPRVPIEAAAAALGITPDALQKRIARGRYPGAVKIKGKWWLPQSTLPCPDGPNGQTAIPPGHSDRSTALLPEGAARVALLEAKIAHLEETVRRLEADKATLTAALDKAQQALLNQQSLALPDRMKDMPQALPTPEEIAQKKPWWKIWSKGS